MLFSLMLTTGIRIGSAIGLDIEDVDLDDGVLWLRTTKGDRPERVLLTETIRDQLDAFVRGRTGPLFVGARGNRLSARHVQRRFSEWCGRTGIRRGATPHSLRHTFATRLYRKTGDLPLVQQALRHRSIASTLVYARCDEARVQAALAE